MAADNTALSAPVGSGETTRSLGDADDLNWFGSWCAYPTTLSPGANVLQIVDLTHGLPVQPQTGAAFPVTDNGGSLTVDGSVSVTGSVAVTGTFYQATQPVSLASVPSHDVTNAGTFAVQVTSLPSGLATSANQVTELASLASIDGKTPALGQALAAGSVPVVLTASQLTTLTPPAAITGFATSAKQDTGNTSLASIDGKITACNTGAVVVASGAITATLAAETTKVIGTVNQGTSPWVVSLTSTTITGTVAATQSGTWNVGTVTTVTGVTTVSTLTSITNVVHVDDNGGSLTVDAPVGTPVFVRLSDGSSAITTLPVSLTSTTITGTVAVTQSGTWTVGLSAAQTLATVTTVSTVSTLTQWNAGHGTAAAALRVELPTDGTGVVGLNAGSAIVGKFGIDQTTPGTTNAVQQIPGTSGGLSTTSFISTAAVQTTQIKGSAGQIYAIEFFNVGAAAVYVRLYNQTGAPASTDGANIIWRGMVPGNTAGSGFVKSWPQGIACGTGIGWRVTGAVADNDTTVLAANQVFGNIEYK